jgi:serine/threonine protein kinase
MEYFECQQETIIVIEFCENGDLLDMVNAHGKFSEDDCKKMFKQVLAAVTYLHDNHIAHRDIKLDNIFQTEDGTLKLGDFGFATTYVPGQKLNRSCGTLTYAAPEMLVVPEEVSYSPELIDVYSLGVVLYGLAVAYLPHDLSDDDELIAEIRSGEYYMPEDLSEGLRDLIRGMLCVDPAKRLTLSQAANHRWINPEGQLQRQGSFRNLLQKTGSRISTFFEQRSPRSRSNSLTESSPRSPRVLGPIPEPSSSPKKKVTLPPPQATKPISKTKNKSSFIYRAVIKPISQHLKRNGSKGEIRSRANSILQPS